MLLNKAVLGLAKLAPTEESRFMLGSVAIEPEQAVVTNGHYLVAVDHTTASSVDYPVLPSAPKFRCQFSSEKPLLLARDAALAALKAIKGLGKSLRHLPILGHAALCDDGKLYVNTTEQVSAFSTGSQEGKFPAWRGIIPSAEPMAEIVLDANYVRLLADYVAEHGEDRAAMRLTIYAKDTACRLDARTTDGQNITALLMPMRVENAKFAARPSDAKLAEPAPVAEPVAA